MTLQGNQNELASMRIIAHSFKLPVIAKENNLQLSTQEQGAIKKILLGMSLETEEPLLASVLNSTNKEINEWLEEWDWSKFNSK